MNIYAQRPMSAFWPFADYAFTLLESFGGKADITLKLRNVR